ncbi:hypothetical protein MSAN_02353000 [Mycena sanguinolenta]|uniref:Uncharacterized protein n=1 Tax=Mycena sanguinolenta TaxID=230812 RepID=A0A8H6X6T4_9AGAR|nr:hypothetical protein MSAN_02353000 [Mycena sanguinolenta]
MPLSDAQLSAVLEAKRILANVGLTTETNVDDRDFQEITRVLDGALPSLPAASGYPYFPPAARVFTAEEIRYGLDCINRQTYVHALVEHPAGAIVEYPETGAAKGVAVVHRFRIDPSRFSSPKESFQYSLGDSHGGEPNVHCGSLLFAVHGTPAYCSHEKWTCKGLKYCSASSLPPSPASPDLDSLAEAQKEIFFKTLALYCTLAEKGSPRSLCKGKLVLRVDEYGRSFIQCEHRKKEDKAHLILRTLDEFDIPYLRALLENDVLGIDKHEELARQFGYGPRVPCSFSATPSAQKELCPHWHRQSGKLARGVLERVKGNCPATFDIYTPYNLSDCPYVVVICRNPPLALGTSSH